MAQGLSAEVSISPCDLPALAQRWGLLVDYRVDIVLRFSEDQRPDVAQLLRLVVSTESSCGPSVAPSLSSTNLLPTSDKSAATTDHSPPTPPALPSPSDAPTPGPQNPLEMAPRARHRSLPGVSPVLIDDERPSDSPPKAMPLRHPLPPFRMENLPQDETPISPLRAVRSCPDNLHTNAPRPRFAAPLRHLQRAESHSSQASESEVAALVSGPALQRPRLMRNFTVRMFGDDEQDRQEKHERPQETEVPRWCTLLLVIVTLAELYCMICIPAFLAFKVSQRAGLHAWNGIVNAVLIFDFVIKAWKAEYRSHFFETDTVPLRKHVRTLGFWADFVASIPLQLAALSQYRSPEAVAGFELNMMAVVYHFRRHLVRVISAPLSNKFSPSAGRLASCFFALLILAHWMDVILWLVITHSPHETIASWLPFHPHLEELKPVDRYLFGFEFSMRLLHGSMHNVMPVTDLQTVFCLFVAIVAVSITATIIAAVESLVEDSDGPKERFLAKIDEATDVMKYLKLPPEFQDEVFSYYRHIYKTGAMLIGSQAEFVLDDLPPDMLRRANAAITQNIIQRVPIFKEYAKNPAFVEKLVGKLKPIVVMPNTAVVRKGEVGNTMYFVARGQLRVVDQANQILKILNSGDFFGEVAIVHECTRTATILADTYCNLFVLYKSDFDEVMSEYPKTMAAVRMAATLHLDQARRRSMMRVGRNSGSTRTSDSASPPAFTGLPQSVSTDFFNPFDGKSQRRRHGHHDGHTHDTHHTMDLDHDSGTHSPRTSDPNPSIISHNSNGGPSHDNENPLASLLAVRSPSLLIASDHLVPPISTVSSTSPAQLNGVTFSEAPGDSPTNSPDPAVSALAAAICALTTAASVQAHVIRRKRRKAQNQDRRMRQHLQARHGSIGTRRTASFASNSSCSSAEQGSTRSVSPRRHSSLAVRRRSVDHLSLAAEISAYQENARSSLPTPVVISEANIQQPASAERTRSASLKDLFMDVFREQDSANGLPPC